MKGDADDIKSALARLLAGPRFLQSLSTVVSEKGDGFQPHPVAAVYQEERLSKLVFPMAELIVFRSNYTQPSETVKAIVHEIGVRWSAVGQTESEVTRYVEILSRATVDLLWESDLDTDVASGPIFITSEDYSPMVPFREHPYLKSVLVMLHVPVWRA